MQCIQPLPRDEATLAVLLDVWESAVRATHRFLAEGDIDTLRPQVKDALAGIEHLCGLYECGTSGTVLGFVGVEAGKVEMLFLHSDARGQGGGRALLRYAIENLRATKLDVNEQNPSAVAFYEHMGFVRAGRSEHDGQGQPFPLLHMEYRGD